MYSTESYFKKYLSKWQINQILKFNERHYVGQKMTPSCASAIIGAHVGKQRALALQVWVGPFRKGNSRCKEMEAQKSVLKGDAQVRGTAKILLSLF